MQQRQRQAWLVTVATQTQVEMGYLLASAALAGWPPEAVVVLGVGNPGMLPGMTPTQLDYCVKTREVRAWVRGACARGALRPEDLVLYVDAYDGMVQDGPQAALQAYEALGSPPLVFSADRWCYPPDAAVHDALVARAAPGEEYRFVCAGAYAGTCAGFLAAFDAYPGIGEPGDDQGRWARAMTDGSPASARWALDRAQTLMASVTGDGRGRVLTRARPRGVPVLHLNGYDNKPVLREAFQRLAAGRPAVICTPPPLPTVDVVVARCAADQDVAAFLPGVARALRARGDLELRRVVVYNSKCEPPVAWPASEPKPDLVQLPASGPESHTYAEHVLRCWDAPGGLPDVLLGLPGSLAVGGELPANAVAALAAPSAAAEPWWASGPGVPWSSVAGLRLAQPPHLTGRTLAQWAAEVLHVHPEPDSTLPGGLGAVLVLRREAALAWPRATWRALRRELALAPSLQPCMERLWGLVCAGSRAPGACLLPKTIWLLWLQGWHTAPAVVWDARATWERLNPSWQVRALDAGTLAELVGPAAFPPGAPLAAVSDLARLLLLAQHGGVWADAGVACFRPLEEWVHPAVRPCGVWMHKSPQRGLAPAAWLIAALPGSTFVAAWLHAALEAWMAKPPPPGRVPLVRLLAGLVAADPGGALAAAWLAVPGRTAHGQGEALCMAAGAAREDADATTLRHLLHRKPFAVKLSWKALCGPRSNGAAVVAAALAGGGATNGDDAEWEPAAAAAAAAAADPSAWA